MWPHVRDFLDFYATTQGRLIRRTLNHRLHEVMGDVRHSRVLAVGFGTPYLRSYVAQAEQVVAVMSGRTGAVVWPRRSPCRVVIADETELPFPDRAFDRVLLIHGLEWTPNPHAMMRELWRVMTDDGRLVVVAPNRRSIWACMDKTPFGHGRPYSRGQLNTLLHEALFTPLSSGGALVVPPTGSRASLIFSRALEALAGRWLTGVAPLTMATAAKRMYGMTPVGKTAPAVAFAEVIGGAPRQRGAHWPRVSEPTIISLEGTPHPRRTGWPNDCRR